MEKKYYNYLNTSDKRHFMGYAYDSLMLRYEIARKAKADFEVSLGEDPTRAMQLYKIDCQTFSKILNDVMEEHD